MHLFFSTLAFTITIYGYWVLRNELNRANTKLPISSWTLWTLINTVLLIAMALGGAQLPQLLQMASYTGGTACITYLVYRKGDWQWTHFDTLIAVLTGASMTVWAATGNPIIAILLCLTALTISSIPMWQALWIDPKSQSEAPWYLWWIGGVCSLLAIESWSYTNSMMPVWILCMQSTTALLIARSHLAQQGENIRGALIATFLFLAAMGLLITMLISSLPHVHGAQAAAEQAIANKMKRQ